MTLIGLMKTDFQESVKISPISVISVLFENHTRINNDSTMEYLIDEFGSNLEVIDDDDEALIDVFKTAWYAETRAATTPGERLHIYRENLGLMPAEFAAQLDNVTTQEIIAAERANMPLRRETAEQVSRFFDVSINRFV